MKNYTIRFNIKIWLSPKELNYVMKLIDLYFYRPWKKISEKELKHMIYSNLLINILIKLYIKVILINIAMEDYT